MRKLLSILAGICLMVVAGNVSAQTTIPNGGFENWVTSPATEPVQWNSNKTGGGYATLPGATCNDDASIFLFGAHSVRIETISYWGTAVNGSCTTGKVEAPTMTKAEGYVHTIAGDPDFSSAFTGRPDSIIGYYRYTSASGDYGKVGVKLHVGNCYDPEAPVGGNHPDATANVIARAVFFTPTSSVSSWTRFSVPFTYVDGRTPEYILIAMTSSGNQAGGSSGSKMWIDGLAVVYNPKLNTGIVANTNYFVSATQGAAITVPFTLTGPMDAGNIVTAELSDASGSFASPIVLGTLNTTVSDTIFGTIPAGTPAGTAYRVRVTSSNAPLTATDNGTDLTINLVTNSVSPDSTQHLDIWQNGSQITVSETPAATSREWKYGTATGGPYTSFVPAETNSSYIPYFYPANSYYLVCESLIAGLTVMSPEVQIIVTDPLTGIENNTNNNTSIYWSSENLVIDLHNSGFNQPLVQLYDLSGRIIAEQKLDNSTVNTISVNVPAGIYMFRIFDNSGIITGKVLKK